MITFTVYGDPVSQGSISRTKFGGTRHTNEKTLMPWRNAIAGACREAMTEQIKGPVAATIEYRLKRPAKHYRTGSNAHLLHDWAPRYPANKMKDDLDRFIRATFDALTQSGMIEDDGCIAQVTASKVYADPDDPWTGATITITTLDGGEKR